MTVLLHADTIKPSLTNTHKRVFDPNNQEDLKIYKKFLETGSWSQKPCPFFLEWPWLTIPHMINHKITESVLEKI